MIIKKKHSGDNPDSSKPTQSKEEAVLDDDVFSQINFDNVNFEQRSERRQGSRRRGYRRIDDRNLISRAQEEAMSIKEIAAKEGHKIGIESAKDDIKKLNESIEEFFGYKDKVYKEVSEGILDISLEIAKKIINTEISVNPEVLLNIIHNMLLDNAKGEDRIVVKVKPEDVNFVKSHIPTILANTQFEAKIMVIADDSINIGGAIVETSNGIIDGSIETQINIIQEAFKKL